jgi:hypothetical protein
MLPQSAPHRMRSGLRDGDEDELVLLGDDHAGTTAYPSPQTVAIGLC